MKQHSTTCWACQGRPFISPLSFKAVPVSYRKVTYFLKDAEPIKSRTQEGGGVNQGHVIINHFDRGRNNLEAQGCPSP